MSCVTRSALLFCLVVGVALAEFKSCSDNSDVTSVLCNGEPTCDMKKGENATFEVTFTPKVSSDTLKSVCHGIIAGIPAPFDDIDANGCNGLTPACPVTSGQSYTFSTTIPVQSYYPSIKLVVKWEEQDADGNDVFCILIPATIG